MASIRLGFCILNFLSILPGFLSREKMTQKWENSKAEQFSKLQFLKAKIDQNTNFAQLGNVKRLFLYESKSYWQLLSFLGYFFVPASFSRERNERKFETKNPTLRLPSWTVSRFLWKTANCKTWTKVPIEKRYHRIISMIIFVIKTVSIW